MQEPFDIELKGIIYSVFPEEEDTYTIFKEGVEYVKIQKDKFKRNFENFNDVYNLLFI